MAQSLETLRSNNITSLWGRRVGLQFDETLAGIKDVKKAVLDLTSASTGTALNAYGTVNYTGTSLATSVAGSGGTFLLALPIPGVDVALFNTNADSSVGSPGTTALTFIRPSTAFVIKSSEGTTMTTINLAVGASVILHGLSTGIYNVKARTTLAGVIINGTT